MKKEENNTKKEFYENWTREQLIQELCWLKQLLKDYLKILINNN